MLCKLRRGHIDPTECWTTIGHCEHLRGSSTLARIQFVTLGYCAQNVPNTTNSLELSTTPEAIRRAANQPPAFYGSRKFITVFTRALHWSLSIARPIQSTPTHSVSPRPISILSTYLCLGLPRGLFPSGFPINNTLLHAPVARQQNHPRQVCFCGDCLGNEATIGQDVSFWLVWGRDRQRQK
jgi:hypothetical protein